MPESTENRMTREKVLAAAQTLRSLEGVVLASLDLRECTLHGMNLRQTRWENVDLTRADLANADLSGAQFHHCRLTRSWNSLNYQILILLSN